MTRSNNNGSEIHRLREFESYDREQFEKLYRVCKPYINKLSRTIDPKRFNVSTDVINSYFCDKFMFVYNKYHNREGYTDERLKATILASLATYRNKLLSHAYTKQAEFNQELTSFEVLFDDSKEWEDDTEDTEYKESLSQRFNEWIRSKLSADEYVLFKTELDPPPFFQERIKESHGKLSVLHVIDFFELPRDRRSHDIITNMRHHIKEVLALAKTEFKI